MPFASVEHRRSQPTCICISHAALLHNLYSRHYLTWDTVRDIDSCWRHCLAWHRCLSDECQLVSDISHRLQSSKTSQCCAMHQDSPVWQLIHCCLSPGVQHAHSSPVWQLIHCRRSPGVQHAHSSPVWQLIHCWWSPGVQHAHSSPVWQLTCAGPQVCNMLTAS